MSYSQNVNVNLIENELYV